MGKGSTQRPSQIPKAEWNHRWDRVFASEQAEPQKRVAEEPQEGLTRLKGKEGAS